MKAKRRTVFLGILCLSLFLLGFSALTAFAEHGRDARTKGDRTSDRRSHTESGTERTSGLEKTKSVSEPPAPQVAGPETTEKHKNSPSKASEPTPGPVISKPKDLPGSTPKVNSSDKNSGTESSAKRNSQATMPQAPERPKDAKSKAPAEPQAPPTAKLSNPSGPDAAKVDVPKASSSAKNSKNSVTDDSNKKNSPLTTGAKTEAETEAASDQGASRSRKGEESGVSNPDNGDGNSAQKDPKAKDSESKNSSKRNSIDKNSNKDSTATMRKDADDGSLFKKAASLAAIIFAKDTEDNKKDAGDDGENGTDIWAFTSKDKEDSSEKDDSDNDWKGRHKDECVDRPELTIKKSADPPSGSTVSPGDKITYTLTYENVGTGTATGVVISDRAPPGTTLVPGSITGGGTVSDGVITWNIGTLSPGDSGNVSFAVTVNDDVADGTVIINKATIDSKETECIVSNKTEHIVEVPPFTIDKQGPAKASPGEEITYIINFKNTSDSDATGVVIKDTLPDHVTVVDAAGGTISGNTITWVIGNLKAGESKTITFKVKIDKSMPVGTTILKNCAEISGEIKKVHRSGKKCGRKKVTKVTRAAKDCVSTEVTVVLLPPVGGEVPKPEPPKPKDPPKPEAPKAPPSIEIPTPISEKGFPTLVAAPAAPQGIAAPQEIALAEEEEVEEVAEVEELAAALPFTGFNFSWLLIGFGMAVLGAALRSKD